MKKLHELASELIENIDSFREWTQEELDIVKQDMDKWDEFIDNYSIESELLHKKTVEIECRLEVDTPGHELVKRIQDHLATIVEADNKRFILVREVRTGC